jgi:hypothetical protein
MLSDNATNFVLAHKLIQCQQGSEPILWKFTTPRAPWQGGVYERLISPLKRAIRAAVKTGKLSRKDFETLVIEVESDINRRPITRYSESEPTRPLRPMDLLLPLGYKCREITIDEDILNDPDFLPKITSRDKLEKTFDTLDKVLCRFRKYWRDYYFTPLKETHKNVEQGQLLPRVGDVVLVHAEKIHPFAWKTAIIEELIPDIDGIIRSAWIRTTTRERIKRHTVHLYPLELGVSPQFLSNSHRNFSPNIPSHPSTNTKNSSNISSPTDLPSSSNQRPKRKAKSNPKYFSDDYITDDQIENF